MLYNYYHAVSFSNLHWQKDSQIKQLSGRWGRRTAYPLPAPRPVDLPVEGAASLKAALIPVVLHYSTADPLA